MKVGPSQFIRSTDPDCYNYVEHWSKYRLSQLSRRKVFHALLGQRIFLCVNVSSLSCVFSGPLLDLKWLPEYAFKEDMLHCTL